MPDAEVASAYVTPGAALGEAGGTSAVGGSLCEAIAAAEAIATRAAVHRGVFTAAPQPAARAPSRTRHQPASRRRSCDSESKSVVSLGQARLDSDRAAGAYTWRRTLFPRLAGVRSGHSSIRHGSRVREASSLSWPAPDVLQSASRRWR